MTSDHNLTRNARTTVVRELTEAMAAIPDGSVIGLGGSVTAGHPMALVRALAVSSAKNLTLVSPTAGLDVDLLISAGKVSRVITSYVGAEGVAAIGPMFRAAVESGEISLWDADEAHCILALRAAGQRLPFLPWLGGIGTSLPHMNTELVEFDDPITGQRLLAVPAVKLDFALILADVADEYGNVQFEGTGFMDSIIASAAAHVIVQAERTVSNSDIRQNPGRTCFWRDTTVVYAPWGTHPYSGARLQADREHLAHYSAAASRAARGDRTDLDVYLNEFVTGVQTHVDYLEKVGIRRLSELVT